MKPSYVRVAVVALVIGGILVLILPFFITRTSFTGISFLTTGQIGDTIGGITAPLIGLLSAFLLFLALRAQIDANVMVSTQLSDQRQREYTQKMTLLVMKQLEFVREDITNFSLSFNDPKDHLVYHGSEAFHLLLEFLTKHRVREPQMPNRFRPEIVRLTSILQRLHDLRADVKAREIDPVDQRYLTAAIDSTYGAQLRPVLSWFEPHRVSKGYRCDECGQRHEGLSEEMYRLYDNLNAMVGS